MASNTYNSYLLNLLDGDVDLGNDTIKMDLATSSYTPDIDTHAFYDDLTNEVSASGSYVAGGATVSITTSQDNTDNESVADAPDVSFTSFTGTARYARFYKSTGTASTSPVLWYLDFGSDQSASGGTFTVSFAAEGILNIGA